MNSFTINETRVIVVSEQQQAEARKFLNDLAAALYAKEQAASANSATPDEDPRDEHEL